ncbi:hypothetical protein [Pseudoalteromonas maricaloris]|uniref:hypothetical protein n=1 Tax=Pseudoalteromonas maricaloris TaxID=184924 RepID=UPI00057E120F|nr:hypothetical protein [Pseudoalteromonas flavipulchra]KID38051.1 hypothetical protein QT15_04605 [Pseudoalteromonas flavipulchra NCIMB 2033 = ATCC BAA-314]MBD0782779.1 hypothetical protein [Pseudoalteromonas flavipulchra]
MAKSTNEELGVIECDGCGTFASIRRRKNGKQLLYLHCKNCGLDQRSGANLQAKWAKAIKQQPQQPQALQSENSEMQTQVVLHNPAPDEWVPQTEQISELGANEHAESGERLTSGTTENSDSDGDGGFNFWGWLAIGAIGVAAIATGGRIQPSR